MSVEVYSIPGCPYCVKLKELLVHNNVQFKDYTVGRDITKEQMIAKLGLDGSQRVTVPQVAVDGVLQPGGFTEFRKNNPQYRAPPNWRV